MTRVLGSIRKITGLLAALGLLAVLGAPPAVGQDVGAMTFANNCSACHQETGEGLPGAFPPLAGHLPEIVAAEGGRAYLISVLLFGLEGEISVKGMSYDGIMPGWDFLADGEIAAVLTYVLASGGNDALVPADFEPITAGDIAAARATPRSAADNHALRAEVLGSGGAAAPVEAPAAPRTVVPVT